MKTTKVRRFRLLGLLALTSMALVAVLVVLAWGQGRAPQVQAGTPVGNVNINFNMPPSQKVLSQCVFIDQKITPKDPQSPKIQIGFACDGLAAGQTTHVGAQKPLTTDDDLDGTKDGNIVLSLPPDGYSFEIDKLVVQATNETLLSPNRVHCDLLNSPECIVKFSFESPVVGDSPVGGLAVDLDGDLGDLPLETAQSSDLNAGVLAGTIAGIAALAVTLGSAAWYARRRWIS